METRSLLRCPACGAESPAESAIFECACGELFDVACEAPLPDVDQLAARVRCGSALEESGVWRFRELVAPGLGDDEIVSLREGATPLYSAPELARWCGCDGLRLKHEGHNPTGSFKDRGMTAAVSVAKRAGARALACASTGNTAASLAAYAAAAGLPAWILAPRDATAPAKLRQALGYGARALLLRGDFDAGMALLREHAAQLGLCLLNSINPWRVQGQQTIVLELLQQLNWQAPDWIAFPAGNLGNCAAFGLALGAAQRAGWIERLPRLLAVQAAGASPFAAAYGRGFDRLIPVKASTVASAIRIGNPVSYSRAVRSIRLTNGVVTAVSDAEILEAKARVDRAGIGAEPASCASIVGLAKLVREGHIDAGESVVCLLSAHLLKDIDAVVGETREIDPTPAALRAALED